MLARMPEFKSDDDFREYYQGDKGRAHLLQCRDILPIIQSGTIKQIKIIFDLHPDLFDHKEMIVIHHYGQRQQVLLSPLELAVYNKRREDEILDFFVKEYLKKDREYDVIRCAMHEETPRLFRFLCLDASGKLSLSKIKELSKKKIGRSFWRLKEYPVFLGFVADHLFEIFKNNDLKSIKYLLHSDFSNLLYFKQPKQIVFHGRRYDMKPILTADKAFDAATQLLDTPEEASKLKLLVNLCEMQPRLKIFLQNALKERKFLAIKNICVHFPDLIPEVIKGGFENMEATPAFMSEYVKFLCEISVKQVIADFEKNPKMIDPALESKEAQQYIKEHPAELDLHALMKKDYVSQCQRLFAALEMTTPEKIYPYLADNLQFFRASMEKANVKDFLRTNPKAAATVINQLYLQSQPLEAMKVYSLAPDPAWSQKVSHYLGELAHSPAPAVETSPAITRSMRM